jgi:N6-L-threonylcarbamoyladenine synthase
VSLLALETSCDDTCAAVVEGRRVLSSVVSSQAGFHERFGGVVPEVASRHHLELVNGVVRAALDDAARELREVDAVAVTRGPGLIGALLVGVATAKALAAPHRKPLVPVDHLQGHVAANFLEPEPLDPPFLCLIASGGHTLLAGVRRHDRFDVLGRTLDDAAGEALDKGARLLGLGYPGGAAIDRLAARGNPEAFDFPRGMKGRPGLDFSFSGVKTALRYRVDELGEDECRARLADIAAGYQRAIVDMLVDRLQAALEGSEWPAVAIGGGVAANSELRGRVEALCRQRGLAFKLPPPELCTDNAAMIGAAASFSEPVPYPDYLAYDAFATGEAA